MARPVWPADGGDQIHLCRGQASLQKQTKQVHSLGIESCAPKDLLVPLARLLKERGVRQRCAREREVEFLKGENAARPELLAESSQQRRSVFDIHQDGPADDGIELVSEHHL